MYSEQQAATSPHSPSLLPATRLPSLAGYRPGERNARFPRIFVAAAGLEWASFDLRSSPSRASSEARAGKGSTDGLVRESASGFWAVLGLGLIRCLRRDLHRWWKL